MEKNHAKLCRLFKTGSLKTLADELLEAGIITRDVQTDPTSDTIIKVVVFSVGGCYSNQFLVLQASCCIQSGSILYFLEATPTRGYNYSA